MSGRGLILIVLLFFVAAMWGLSFASRQLENVASGIMPLEPRAFEQLSVVTVGTGGTHENHLRLGPCVAVGLGETLVLVDAGRAVAQALRAARIPVAQPRTLLLTSLLPENTLGIDDWLMTASLDAGRTPLRVVGPPGTRALVEAIVSAHGPGVAVQLESLGLSEVPEVEVEEVSGAWQGTAEALSLRGVSLEGGPLAAVAWRIEGGDRAVTISGVGWSPDRVTELARGSDVLVHEAISGEALENALAAGLPGAETIAREGRLHTRVEDVGALAGRAGVRTLVLTRLRPPPVFAFGYQRTVGEDFRGRVVIAEDGEEITP